MKMILGLSFPQTDAASVAPVDDVGIDMTQFGGQSKSKSFLATVTVTGGASNVSVWGALAQGAEEDATDDVWGLHQDPLGAIAPLGLLGTALPVGTYHFMIDGLGLYSRVYFQKSANTVDVILTEIHEAGRGN